MRKECRYSSVYTTEKKRRASCHTNVTTGIVLSRKYIAAFYLKNRTISSSALRFLPDSTRSARSWRVVAQDRIARVRGGFNYIKVKKYHRILRYSLPPYVRRRDRAQKCRETREITLASTLDYFLMHDASLRLALLLE